MLNDNELRERMIMFRGTHTMTQDKFAELSGIAKSTINRIETGMRKPNAFTRMKLISFMEGYKNDMETNNEEN